jgi:ORF6N domain
LIQLNGHPEGGAHRQRVLLDSDLAEIYQVSTKAFNQAVKRNAARFPVNFAFRLTDPEKTEVVTNCDHLARLKPSSASGNWPFSTSN